MNSKVEKIKDFFNWKVISLPGMSRKGERGIALLMVISALAFLAAISIDFQYDARVNLALADNQRNALKATYLCHSAINISRLVLIAQMQLDEIAKKGLMQKVELWRLIPIDSEVVKSMASGDLFASEAEMDQLEKESPQDREERMKEETGFGDFDGHFGAFIEAEDAKINLNGIGGTWVARAQPTYNQLFALIQPDLYNFMFETMDENGQFTDRKELINATRDWIDDDEEMDFIDPITGFKKGSGYEDSRYNMLKSPYQSKNAELYSIAEAYLIKGFNDEFMELFADRFTVYPNRKINVQAADPQVIRALLHAFAEQKNDPIFRNHFQMDQILKKYVETRTMSPMKKVKDFIKFFTNEGIRLKQVELKKSIDVISKIYSIKAQAEVGKVVKNITTVIESNDKGGKYLYWREE